VSVGPVQRPIAYLGALGGGCPGVRALDSVDTLPVRSRNACAAPCSRAARGQSPANAYAERFVLTARTEVTDRMLIFGQRHLLLALAEYEAHYKGRRPHRSRQRHPPRPDHPAADLSQERIKRRPVLGGLISEYERAA
jgi:integrase-like protein